MRYLVNDSKASDTGTISVQKPLTNKKIKCMVRKTKEYQYILADGVNHIPLQMGNGIYTIRIYEQLSGDRYELADERSIDVTLKNPLSVYLNPNVFADYSAASLPVVKARELCLGLDARAKVAAVCKFVKGHLDYNKGFSPEAIYHPDIDKAYSTRKGLCMDYAAMTAAMLRSQGVPCKVVFGHTGNGYHAWNEAYTGSWERMDLTFSDNGVPDSYVDDGRNYVTEYVY